MLDKTSCWQDVPILCIDTETSGFPWKGGRAVEISMIVFQGREVVEHFTTYINPGHPIPADVTRIHGITDDMVAGAPRFHDIEDRVVDLLSRGMPWVMHNAAFDTEVLSREIPGERWPVGIPVLCTLEYARKHGYRGRAKLQDLKTTFSLPDPGDAHGAFPDAWLTGHLARTMVHGEVFSTLTGYSEQYRFRAITDPPEV